MKKYLIYMMLFCKSYIAAMENNIDDFNARVSAHRANTKACDAKLKAHRDMVYNYLDDDSLMRRISYNTLKARLLRWEKEENDLEIERKKLEMEGNNLKIERKKRIERNCFKARTIVNTSINNKQFFITDFAQLRNLQQCFSDEEFLYFQENAMRNGLKPLSKNNIRQQIKNNEFDWQQKINDKLKNKIDEIKFKIDDFKKNEINFSNNTIKE